VKNRDVGKMHLEFGTGDGHIDFSDKYQSL
jgi:hypothetical protein